MDDACAFREPVAVNVTDAHFPPGATTRREMDSLSRLANSVAHDYNNLLSGIIGYAGMLEMLSDLPPKALQYLQELQKSAARLTDMNQRLLLFGRRRAARSLPVDLNAMIDTTLRSAFSDSLHSIRFDRCERPLTFRIEPDPFQSLVTTLVSNALTAVDARRKTCESLPPPVEEVVIRTEPRVEPRPVPTYFGPAPAGEYGAVEVRDAGIGFPPESLDRFFEPFAHEEFRPVGRGLGLAIVYRIVHNHGGYLQIESEPNAGTRVVVLFPLKDGDG